MEVTLTVEQLINALALADVSYLITPSAENKEKLKTKITITEATIPEASYKGKVMFLTDSPSSGALPLDLMKVDV